MSGPIRIPLSDDDDGDGNSAYLLPERRAVVDPGPPTDAAWRNLRSGLSAAGVDASDVERVFLTHWHGDHAGLLARLHEVSGAAVTMHEADAALVADYERERRRRLDRDARRMREWGVPDSTVSTVIDDDDPSSGVRGVPVEDVTDGAVVDGVELLHAPGHTLGHAAYRVDGTMLVGDAVLPTYTPNVGGGDTRQRDALADTLATLDRLERVAPETVAPGHGGPLPLAPRLAAMRAHHEERSRRVRDALDGPTTPWEVATSLFGEMRGVHVKLGAGEAAAHLVHLADRGAVEAVDDDPVRYVAVGDAAGP